MKKKILFLGFIIGVFVTLMTLPTSAKLPTKPAPENMCDACSVSWEVVDSDHCNWSGCTCKLQICPTCGNNSVLVYCHTTHKVNSFSLPSGAINGQSYDVKPYCSQCKNYLSATVTYYSESCSVTKAETVSPTCVSRGYDLYVCTKGHSDCKNALFPSYGRKCNFKSALSYSHDYSYVTTFEADCANMGFDYYECSKCYLPMAKNIVPAGDHSPIGEVVHHAATCTQTGYDEFECSGCNQIVQVVTSGALGHIYSSSVTKKATCNDNIYISYITDEIPDNLAEGYSGCRAIEEKIRRNDVKLVGLQTDDWSQLIGCEIDFGYVKDLKGKLKINKVFVQGTSIDDKKQNKKES